MSTPRPGSCTCPACRSGLQSADHPSPRATTWLEQLRRIPALDARAFAVYLERETEPDHRFSLLFLAMFAGVALAGWSMWISGELRRPRPTVAR